MVVARLLWRDLRAAAAQIPGEIGRLVVIASVDGGPPVGGSYPLDAVTTLGRDVNNTIAVEDGFVSAEHAVLSYRGRVWYLEDRESANGTFANGRRVEDPAPVAFGDEIQLGRVQFRLERPRPARRP